MGQWAQGKRCPWCRGVLRGGPVGGLWAGRLVCVDDPEYQFRLGLWYRTAEELVEAYRADGLSYGAALAWGVRKVGAVAPMVEALNVVRAEAGLPGVPMREAVRLVVASQELVSWLRWEWAIWRRQQAKRLGIRHESEARRGV